MPEIAKLNQRAKACTSLMLLLFCAAFALPSNAVEQSIASKHQDDLLISISNQTGNFTGGKNNFCVSFSSLNSEAVSIGHPVIEFEQQAGKIRERAIPATISPETPGRYCGEVDLGKQHYQPAFYYVYVRYIAPSGKRKKCRFFLKIK